VPDSPAPEAVDLFAGPGGWDVAARELGLDPLGIEWDDAACATRKAAGLRTLQADVAALDPSDFVPVASVIGSPPCPTFSTAGNGAAKHLTDVIVASLLALADGRDTRAETRAEAFETLRPVTWEAEQAKARKAKREPDRAKADERARRDADIECARR
jgi:DNA (cytosine-5)-methyltransferase 1